MNAKTLLVACTALLAPGALLADDTPPPVAVFRVTRKDLFQELTIQGELRPYQEVELHAMVSGYLSRIPVDFGDRVRKGEVIAVLEAPELNDELEHAVAAREQASAAHAVAHLDFTRLSGVSKTQSNLVAPQELDAAQARDGTTEAQLAAAKADVAKYTTLLGYTKIAAPFDGVVTARYADPGTLVQTGTTQSTSLVRVSENQVLRLDFPVSVSYVDDIAVGQMVEIRLTGSGRTLHSPVSRFSRRVDMATRTMETEVEVENPDLSLIPGMYATVVLRVHERPMALSVPVEAVGDLEHPSALVVGADGLLSERPLKLGVETPASFEVLSGLSEGDMVMVGSRAAVHPGERVEARLTEPSRQP